MSKIFLGKQELQAFDWESKKLLNQGIKLLKGIGEYNLHKEYEKRTESGFIDKLSNMIK